ncbi:hypothetical protein BU14_0320s0022 [Porphyra umbilicalis]|uniref:Spondin domain-containing protein n=1 Tax=Porphyra umbilicalis TaxID=2786 RepID=A0A1X6NZ71_PORUM|nr:hypothetical protein BU14_0320s0022 [Porphyra umbilicalis]|eukprot:OSX73911.1 hypothetical protein BU14_0320s0022 [Porphyra umbilicalis]
MAFLKVAAAAAAAVALAAAVATSGADARSWRSGQRVSRNRMCSGKQAYQVTLKLNWSGATHPRSYPEGGHFSPPTAAIHSSRYQMWAPGSFASQGIQNVAETGDPAVLREELGAYEAARHVASWDGTGAPTESGVVTVKLNVTADGAAGAVYASGATMLFPSPDWFTGFYNVRLCRYGRWVGRTGGKLRFWDSGTDSGREHLSEDEATEPPTTIFSLQNGRFPAFGRGVGHYEIRAM